MDRSLLTRTHTSGRSHPGAQGRGGAQDSAAQKAADERRCQRRAGIEWHQLVGQSGQQISVSPYARAARGAGGAGQQHRGGACGDCSQCPRVEERSPEPPSSPHNPTYPNPISTPGAAGAAAAAAAAGCRGTRRGWRGSGGEGSGEGRCAGGWLWSWRENIAAATSAARAGGGKVQERPAARERG